MPGHPVPPNLVHQTESSVQTLQELFDQHDAVYLLMDSRESRWLPTLLGAAKRKVGAARHALFRSRLCLFQSHQKLSSIAFISGPCGQLHAITSW